MEAANAAIQILSYLGVYKAFGILRRYRYATPERLVMGRHGTKRAGAFGKGLRNWINRAQAEKQANRLQKNHV